MLNLILGMCLTPTVSLESSGMRAGDVVASFAKQSGENLVCAPNVANEPLAIWLENADFEKAKQHLAWAVAGAWRKEEDRLILERSNSLIVQQERADDKAMQARIAKLIADASESLKDAPKFDEAMANTYLDRNRDRETNETAYLATLNKLKLSSPTFRQGITWLKAIGTTKLASIPVGGRAVFSDFPTSLQHKLPSSKSEIQAHMSAGDLLNERQRALGKEPSYQAFIDYLTMGGKGDASKYYKTLFAVQRRSFAVYWFQMYCVDQRGQLIVGGQGTIPNRLGSNLLSLPGKGKRLEIDDASRKLGRVLTDLGVAMGMSSMPIKLSDGSETGVSYSVSSAEQEGVPYDFGVGNLIRQPYVSDPLGFGAGQFLLQVAKNRNVALIGTMSDSTLMAVARALRGQVRTDDDLIAFLTEGSDQVPHCEAHNEPGWFTLRPMFPSQSYAARFNRRACQDLIKKMRTKGVLSLSDACEYARVSPGPWSFASLDLVLMSHAAPEVSRFTVEQTLQGCLDILVGLGMPLKQIEAGRRRFDSLPKSVQNSIYRWISTENWIGRSLGMREMDTSGLTLLQNETTEVGTNADLSLDIKVADVPCIQARIENGHVLDLEIGSLAYEEKQPEIPREGGISRRKFSSYELVTRRSYTFTVTLGGRHITRFASEILKQPGSKPGKRSDLPANILNNIEEAKKKVWGG